MRVLHLMASPFFGGPERQMVGLARQLPPHTESIFASFGEQGRADALLDAASAAGFQAIKLKHNFPNLLRSRREVADTLSHLEIDLITCSGYKPDIVGWGAARATGTPVVVVSHGWTGATCKVRVYEAVDKWVHRQADMVVSVSEAQADKVRRCGVATGRMVTIHNSVDEAAFRVPEAGYRQLIEELFAVAPRHVVGAVGRLSPEKGFDVLIEAATAVVRVRPDIGFVVLGDGPCRADLEKSIEQRGLTERVILAGFRPDAAKYFANFDAVILPSRTEGLPTVVLEAFAAGVPVVAARVGGIPEVVVDAVSGFLVEPERPDRLAARVLELFQDDARRAAMGVAGRARVRNEFLSSRQAARYQQVFDRLVR